VLGGLPTGAAARAPFDVSGVVCTNCGFDLTGLRSDGGCPECGIPVARSIPPWAALGGEPFVVSGHPCLNCGYDLTGLSSDGACPECGTPVERSLKGNLLRFAAPAYVRGLATGILITEAASIGALVNMFFPVGIAFAAQGAGVSGAGVALVTASAAFVLSAASFAGWWMFSAPEPARLGIDEAIGARKLLRVSVVAELAISFARFATSVLLPVGATKAVFGPAVGPGAGAPLWMGIVAASTALLGVGAYLLRFFSSMAYLRSVARRFPDAEIYKMATRFMWLGPVLAAASIVTCFISLAVAFVFYLIILDRTRRQLRATLAAMNSTDSAGFSATAS
jgi:hypothetical protein